MERIKYFLNNYIYICLFLFIVGLFIGGRLLVLALLVFIISIIVKKIHGRNYFKLNTVLLLLILFYLWHIIGYFYSINKGVALFDFEVKLSILIFPLLFMNKYSILNLKKLSKIYVIISIIYGITILCNSLISFYMSGQILYYSDFSIFLHPSYYTMYLDLSIIFSIGLIINNKNIKKRIFYFISLIILITNIYFADSKSGYIATIIVLAYILLYFGLKKNKIITISFFLLFLALSFLVVKNNYRFQSLLNNIYNYNNILKNPENKNSSTSMRILAWNASYQIIKENTIIGVGSGDIKTELNKKYKELKYNYLIKYNLNSHNQFLETWLGQGIIGFVLLLLVFIIPFIDAIKRKNILLQSFLLLIFINFLFESMLDTQAGTIFFGFFYSLLVIKQEEPIS